jgi:MFS family permease
MSASLTGAEPPAGQRVALATLAGALLLAMTTWFSAAAVLPQLRAAWGLSDLAGSLLTIAVQLGFVVGALLAAALNLPDLVPPRRLMLCGAVGAAAANALLLIADGPALAILLRFATGVALAGVYPPALKAMATWFRTGRGAALGAMVGALTVGSAVPHLINGVGGVDWRPVVAVTSALTLAGGVLACAVAKDGPYPFPRGVFAPHQVRAALGNRGVRLASLGYFGHMWELYAMWAWFAAFCRDVLAARGHSDPGREAALITFAVIAVGALGCVIGGLLGDRWGRPRIITLSLAVSGACAVVMGFLERAPLPLVLGVGLVWGFAVIADSAQFSALVSERADQRYVGTALTLQLALGFVLTVATIWLIPVARDLVGWRWAFSLLALGPALGIAAMLRLEPAGRHEEVAAHPLQTHALVARMS